LSKPFSNRFELTALDWPGSVEAEEIVVTVDYLGFLPNHPWATALRVRDGEVMLSSNPDDKKTINPQALVDAVEVDNVVLRFTRGKKLREVTIVKASGSFSSGTVSGEATAGKNHITFENLKRAGDGSLDGMVTAKGENLKDLAEIVGASAPDTPPFDVNGVLRMRERTWSVSSIDGRMGDSDIGGDVAIDLKPKKPFLTVALKSNKLDFDDMGVVFGIPVGTGKGETTNEEQRDAKAKFDRSARLIPDTKIDFARLAAVNADISFEAPKVIDAPMAINAMTFKGTLRDQVLDFKRFVVRTGSTGDLDAKVHIDARSDPAKTKATGKLDKLPITRIINTSLVRGTLNGAFSLNMTGSGFREAFGSATGEAGIWSTNSEVAKIATEAAGLDLGEIALLLIKNDDRDYLKSRCLAGNLSFRNGVATIKPAVIDNEDSLIYATGGFNLKTERLDIEVGAKPHDVSIGKVFGDIKVEGTMRNPDIKALDEKTVLQAGLSAILAGITGALGALPFVEFGGEPDAPCQQLLADSRSLSKKPVTPPVSKKSETQKQKS
ncbi:MAG: AsmA family protein, partial [Hyphomonadaceae bacterium]|nr:AsmA family protein [Hyphomonadaceae bacterium]